MTIGEALQQATLKLKQYDILSAHLDAEVLLTHILKQDKAFLYAHSDKKLTSPQNKKLQTFVRQRTRQIPIAYIVGHKEFYGFDFKVSPAVLIPRPETELLIEKVLELLPDQQKKLVFADIGTGSGCVAIILKKLFPKSIAIASDISSAALEIAKANARIHHAKVSWFKGSLLAPLQDQKFDLVVANLPYVPLGDFKKLPQKHPLRHEPKQALWSGDDGLDLYRKFFGQIAKMKHQPATIICEFDPRQYKTIQKLVKQKLPGYRQEGFRDLAGMWRGLVLSS